VPNANGFGVPQPATAPYARVFESWMRSDPFEPSSKIPNEFRDRACGLSINKDKKVF